MDDAFVGKVRMSTGALFGVFVPNDITTQRVIMVAANMAIENMRDEIRDEAFKYDCLIDEISERIVVLEEALREIASTSKIMAKGKDMEKALMTLLSSHHKIACAALAGEKKDE